MDTTFKFWANKWIKFQKGEVQENTLIEYEKLQRHLVAEFDELSMENITPKKVQELLDRLYQQGLAKSSINKRKYMIQQVFRYANIQGLEISNPCSFVKTPRMAAKNHRRALTQGEVEIVLLHRNNFENGFYAYCLLMTGLRRSEMLALKWEDLDFKQNLICVNKAVVYVKGQPFIRDYLKNGDQERIIPMPKTLEPILKKHPGIHKGLIFGENPYTPINPNAHSWQWIKYKQQTSLDITQHMIRHTYCTMLYDAGIDVKTASYLMGHKDIHTTLAIYTHLEKQRAVSKAAGKLNVFINDFSPQHDRL